MEADHGAEPGVLCSAKRVDAPGTFEGAAADTAAAVSAASGAAISAAAAAAVEAAAAAGASAADGSKLELPEDGPPELDESSESVVKHFTWNRQEVGTAASDSRLLPTVFRWNDEGNAIFISGSYDNWTTKMPLVRSADNFYTIVDVPEGTHQYKYLVDDEWKCHANEPKVNNGIGSQNNIITIKGTDYELPEIKVEGECGDSKGVGGEFSQSIPPKESSYCFLRHGPPAAPPHLLETILDRPVPAHCEPTMVAVPTHVILNHLYTLSIKDGIMVMSMTHRYRKKYVTTLLYRPIVK